MKPLTLLFIASLLHPAISGTMAAFGVFASLIGAKGAPVGLIYDVLSLAFFALNIPGALITMWWWGTPVFQAPGWSAASTTSLIILSRASWTALAYALLKIVLPAYQTRFPPPESGL